MSDYLDLEAIKKRCEKATGGPWHHQDGTIRRSENGYPLADMWEIDDVLNADFIAHARTDIPALITEAERLRTRELELAKYMTSALAQRDVAIKRATKAWKKCDELRKRVEELESELLRARLSRTEGDTS